MNFDEIKTFISVSDYGSITSASEHLFLSQSTVSSRIKSLESELGVKLMERGKGHRKLELTIYGKRIREIFLQQIELYEQGINWMRNPEETLVRIASVDIINNQTLVPFFKKIIEKKDKINLSISTFHSEEIHSLISNRKADIGFVYSQIQYPNIISKPIYRELFYLVCHKKCKYYDGINPYLLNEEDEIYIKWNDDFELWHDQFWDRKKVYLTINTGSMLGNYIHQDNKWAIAPKSVVDKLTKNENICAYSLTEMPPAQICYRLVHRSQNEMSKNAIDWINQELDNFIKENESICTFKDWMLNTSKIKID